MNSEIVWNAIGAFIDKKGVYDIDERELLNQFQTQYESVCVEKVSGDSASQRFASTISGFTDHQFDRATSMMARHSNPVVISTAFSYYLDGGRNCPNGTLGRYEFTIRASIKKPYMALSKEYEKTAGELESFAIVSTGDAAKKILNTAAVQARNVAEAIRNHVFNNEQFDTMKAVLEILKHPNNLVPGSYLLNWFTWDKYEKPQFPSKYKKFVELISQLSIVDIKLWEVFLPDIRGKISKTSQSDFDFWEEIERYMLLEGSQAIGREAIGHTQYDETKLLMSQEGIRMLIGDDPDEIGDFERDNVILGLEENRIDGIDDTGPVFDTVNPDVSLLENAAMDRMKEFEVRSLMLLLHNGEFELADIFFNNDLHNIVSHPDILLHVTASLKLTDAHRAILKHVLNTRVLTYSDFEEFVRKLSRGADAKSLGERLRRKGGGGKGGASSPPGSIPPTVPPNAKGGILASKAFKAELARCADASAQTFAGTNTGGIDFYATPIGYKTTAGVY